MVVKSKKRMSALRQEQEGAKNNVCCNIILSRCKRCDVCGKQH